MENKYWELRENMERTHDKYVGKETAENYIAYLTAKGQYEDFCMRIVEKLMDENPDVLARLK